MGTFFFSFCPPKNCLFKISSFSYPPKKWEKKKKYLQRPGWPQFRPPSGQETNYFLRVALLVPLVALSESQTPLSMGLLVISVSSLWVIFVTLLLDFSDTNRHISWFSNSGSITRLANSPILPIFPIFLKSPYISLYFPKFALCAKCYTFTTHRK